jgi:hypothetical protein
LTVTDASLQDFERLLSTECTSSEPESETYGELDRTLEFHPLTEMQMVHRSLEALEEYRLTEPRTSSRMGGQLGHRQRDLMIPSIWTKSATTDVERHYSFLEPIDPATFQPEPTSHNN